MMISKFDYYLPLKWKLAWYPGSERISQMHSELSGYLVLPGLLI